MADGTGCTLLSTGSTLSHLRYIYPNASVVAGTLWKSNAITVQLNVYFVIRGENKEPKTHYVNCKLIF